MVFAPLTKEHLLAVSPTEAQTGEMLVERPDAIRALAHPELAWAALDPASGRVLGCAGVLPQWPGRAIAWALAGPMTARQWRAATVRARQVLDRAHALGFDRIEATALLGFEPGAVWLRHLGFTPLCPKAKWFAGQTYWEWERVR